MVQWTGTWSERPAALFFDRTLFGYSAFILLLIPAALFFDGG